MIVVSGPEKSEYHEKLSIKMGQMKSDLPENPTLELKCTHFVG